MIIKTSIAFLLISISLLTHSNEESFKIVEKESFNFELEIDEKIIANLDVYKVNIKHYEKVKGGGIVILELSSGGANCPFGYIIVEKINDKITFGNEFGNCYALEKIRIVNEFVYIDFPSRTDNSLPYLVTYNMNTHDVLESNYNHSAGSALVINNIKSDLHFIGNTLTILSDVDQE